ncbi:MAG: hypothetical protein IPM92_00395 [Saprospiraceae bacterium]|nr:hypothetical protein [Saprospiraceae bacterium]
MNFYSWLSLTAIASFILSYLFKKENQPEGILSAQMILVCFFIIFTLTIFYVAKMAIKSANPYLFTRVFMVSVFFKMLLLSLLVFSLVKIFALVPRQLAIPLGVSYLLFTIFETWVLMKLSKTH